LKEKKHTFLIKSCNLNAEVDIENYLLSFLTPTTPGTNYWDSPTEAKLVGLSEREISRIVSQVDEILKILKDNKNLLNYNNELNFLDVGTGNGMVPRLLSTVNHSINATGIDPYLHGGHKTSWQTSDSKENLRLCLELWQKLYDCKISTSSNETKYHEHKRFLDEHIKKSNIKYNIVYCKAIEHVPNWSEFADQLSSVLEIGGVLIIKHRSFFSYLGPHRYSTTGIPWGHCLLNEFEYKKYAETFHPERSNQMIDFYFNGLSNPRMTISQLIRKLNSNNLDLVSLNLTKPKYADYQFSLINKMPSYIDLILKKNPSLSYEEMTSGLVNIVLQKKSTK
tara:strand:+ start:14807 stop:15817 length:1011 start_codon:yes stop_codon:yes gene_type:complete